MASLVIQEELARVRTVNGHVASIAFTTRGETQPSVGDVRRLRVDVALQAKEPAFTAQQQHPADCPVWGMTGRAPLYLHRGVFVDERPTLLRVTINATFPVCLFQHGLVAGPVRAVTIRALHQALRHAMMRGEREGRLNSFVATEAQVGLLLPKQALMQPAILFYPHRNLEELGLG